MLIVNFSVISALTLPTVCQNHNDWQDSRLQMNKNSLPFAKWKKSNDYVYFFIKLVLLFTGTNLQ